ncbi:cytochrome D ubiquinol oxidase subunit II [Mycobacterium sherrisii]|uniref:Cytochrome D ubiquinol oxidase subunit II n=2 Tax=Mycobacterium sherrisii TaxID=243061 RepID=A0A1E3SV76_9MYCO|nr:cytochrome d ubiquinol oxidase subunit II [Mycobacterium sherrisii]ODR06061.1 cytochrome D ubiquinol oxidase subunit II [Mycobacterium sherrisii]ORW76729.1 cytochrome D ubiquinol oxidase subunit II [Mycobacterium sherrisii]
MAGLVAVLLFVGVVSYAVLGGADFGAGFWDLAAGGTQRGKAPRALIDSCVAPVWEANHIWLIYSIVMLWSGFPTAFAAITTTLYLPLMVAALGIVLRGAGFAFRKETMVTPERRFYGVVFAASSVLTPYCFGAIAGAVASGRVPSGGYGDPVRSWVNPASALGGVLAVLACAFLAATYLTVAASRAGDEKLTGYFRRRALAAGGASGAVSLVGIAILRADAPRLFTDLTHVGLPLVTAAGLGGVASIGMLMRQRFVGVRETAAAAVAAVVAGWGVSQYPNLLGTHLTVGEAAAPRATLAILVAVACAAVVLVLPPLLALFRLAAVPSAVDDPQQR